MLHSLYDNTSYVFNALTLQTLAVALGLFALGIYALIREQMSHVSVVIFILMLSMGLWLFAFSWMNCAVDEDLALWWAKLAYVGITAIPAAVYNFSTLMFKDYEKDRRRVLAIWIFSFLYALTILTTDIQFSSLYRYSWGFYPRSGVASIPFILYFTGVMIVSLRIFVVAYRGAIAGSAQETRARELLIIFSIGYLSATDFLISFGVPWYPLGYIPVFLFIVLAARSIRHHRFMTITPALAAREIIDTMNDALIVLDSDGVVRLVNPATRRLFGCRAEDLVGKRPSGGCMAKSAAFAEQLESICRSGAVQNSEIIYEPPDDNSRHILNLSISTMKNPIGEILASVCVAADATGRKRAQEERERLIDQLRDANQKLRAMDRMKSDFISVVSHELRTPLTTIKAFVELIIMKPGMPEQQKKKLMGTVNAETDRLSRLIADLLDLARIEAGSMKWRVDAVSIDDLVREVIAGMGLIFEGKGLRVTTDFASPLPRLAADRDRLVQVVTNLLSNAVKFTQAGGAITVAIRHETAPLPQIVVAITDTGMGIPAGDLEMIFEKFQRSGDEMAAAVEGTGLGLAIARQIVEYHGGRIWAESTQGKGSVFTFTLPLAGKRSAGL